MTSTLTLLQRPKIGDAPILGQPIDYIARGWQRSTRDVGGYLTGGFEVLPLDVTRVDLQTYFNTWLGRQVVEKTQGLTSWHGYIVRMSLILDGGEYVTTLEPSEFRNSVIVDYSNSAVVDTNQGALSASATILTDAGQDFSTWATAAGTTAAYRVQAVNDADATGWAYMGPVGGGGNTEIQVFQDAGLSTTGWNDEDLNGDTVVSYEVIQVSLENSRTSTSAANNTDSQAEYGTVEGRLSVAGATATSAAGLRDSDLAAYEWPRSRLVATGRGVGDSLSVTVVGFWATTMWTYRTYSETGAASDVITNLANDCEFVTATTGVTTNALEITADAYPIPQRIGDLIVRATEKGDGSGGLYNVGVYNDRRLVYEAQETVARYYLSGGVLYDDNHMRVEPGLLRPGFIVRGANRLGTNNPPGSTGARYDPGSAYVDEVWYERDTGELRLSLADQVGASVLVLKKQIAGGV